MDLTYLVWVHIAFGSVALFAAPGAMIAKKGSLWHRRFGKTFFWSMMVVVSTACFVAIEKELHFLFFIALFSFYFIFMGYRSLYHKTAGKVSPLDWLGVSVGFLASVGLGILGVLQFQSGSNFGIVPIIFGVLGVRATILDFLQFRRPSTEKFSWMFRHLKYMIIGYVATVTAVSAINFTFLPKVVAWLWPTIAGGIAIFAFTRHFKGKVKEEHVDVETKL